MEGLSQRLLLYPSTPFENLFEDYSRSYTFPLVPMTLRADCFPHVPVPDLMVTGDVTVAGTRVVTVTHWRLTLSESKRDCVLPVQIGTSHWFTWGQSDNST